jgi:hypothetical protein
VRSSVELNVMNFAGPIWTSSIFFNPFGPLLTVWFGLIKCKTEIVKIYSSCSIHAAKGVLKLEGEQSSTPPGGAIPSVSEVGDHLIVFCICFLDPESPMIRGRWFR